MNSNGKEYAAKLTSCEQAASAVQDGDTVIHGITIAEPPGLLSAIAKRARAGEFQQIKVYTFNAQKHFALTLGSPDISDVVDSYSWFVSEGSRNMVRVGLEFIRCCQIRKSSWKRWTSLVRFAKSP
jgi:itaconate CoA-transferase